MSHRRDPDKHFDSKIPESLWSTIWGWHCAGVTLEDQLVRLRDDHGVNVSNAPLRRLIHKMIEDRNEQVQAVIADRAAADINSDYSKLDKLEARLESVMKRAEATQDDHLLLKTADREIKLRQLKFAISANNRHHDREDDIRESLATGLLGKLTKRG